MSSGGRADGRNFWQKIIFIDLYFSTKNGARKYLDGKFLALAQGLETLHRRTSSELSMSESDFEKMLSEILDNCPPTHKEWLKMKLYFANELSLRKRLQDLFEPYIDVFGNKKDIKDIIDKIKHNELEK